MNENMELQEKELQTDVIKCSNCGANMVFNATTQNLHCEHCNTSISFEKDLDIVERDFLSDSDTGESWNNETVVIKCNNCGSTEVISKNDISRICPFCGTSNIIQTEALPGIKPNAVFPFTVSKDCCLVAAKKWIKRKWYVPSKCKKTFRPENINGVYSPCWTIDSETTSYYEGVLGRVEVRTVGSGKNSRTETRVKYFNVSGIIEKFYDDIMIEASPQIDQKTLDKVRPFDKTSACVYDKKFLSGFVANHYDKDVNCAFKEAKVIMDKDIKNSIMSKHNATLVQSLNVSTKYTHIKYKYILLPIWVGNYKYKSKQYNYFINGNTSKVVGKVPKSPLKITIAVLAGVTLIVGGFFLYFFIRYRQIADSYDIENSAYSIEENNFSTDNYQLDGYKLIF